MTTKFYKTLHVDLLVDNFPLPIVMVLVSRIKQHSAIKRSFQRMTWTAFTHQQGFMKQVAMALDF